MKKILLLLVLAVSCIVAAHAENYPYRSDYLWLTVPDHADWLYKVGEKAKVEVSFYLYGMPQIESKGGSELLSVWYASGCGGEL